VLPKHLDEKVARLQLKKLAADRPNHRGQARYIGVRAERSLPITKQDLTVIDASKVLSVNPL